MDSLNKGFSKYLGDLLQWRVWWRHVAGVQGGTRVRGSAPFFLLPPAPDLEHYRTDTIVWTQLRIGHPIPGVGKSGARVMLTSA